MSPSLVKKAASFLVFECTTPGVYHVGNAKGSHTIKVLAVGQPVCDCEAGSRDIFCSHRLRLNWYLEAKKLAAQAPQKEA